MGPAVVNRVNIVKIRQRVFVRSKMDQHGQKIVQMDGTAVVQSVAPAVKNASVPKIICAVRMGRILIPTAMEVLPVVPWDKLGVEQSVVAVRKIVSTRLKACVVPWGKKNT